MSILCVNFYNQASAQDLPSGWEVKAGQVEVMGDGRRMEVESYVDRGVMNWESFNIGIGNEVYFKLPGSGSALLNRVVGGGVSVIDGIMRSNGNVYLLNPNGIVVGKDAVINIHGGMLGTMAVSDEVFMRGGDMKFDNVGGGMVDIGGRLEIEGERFTILAKEVKMRDGSEVVARRGRVDIGVGGSGYEVYVKPEGSGGAYIRSVGRGEEGGMVDLRGRIEALGVQVEAVGNAYGLAINLGEGGEILTHGEEVRRAEVVMVAREGDVEIRGAVRAYGGEVEIESERGDVRVSGVVDVSVGEGVGGEVKLMGDRIRLNGGSEIKASGDGGGGEILIGGDWEGEKIERKVGERERNARVVWIEKGARVEAQAREVGDGGKVVVWGDRAAVFYGEIEAGGGDGGRYGIESKGGRVEISSKGEVLMAGEVNTKAKGGDKGILLLDPVDINIIAGTTPVPGGLSDNDWDFNEDVGITQLGATTLQNLLATSTVFLKAQNDVNFNAPVTWNSASGLIVSAGNNIVVNAAVTNTDTSLAGFGLTFWADVLPYNNGLGSVIINAPVSVGNGTIFMIGKDVMVNATISAPKLGEMLYLSAENGVIQGGSGAKLIANELTLEAKQGITGSGVQNTLAVEVKGSMDFKTTNGDIRIVNTAIGPSSSAVSIGEASTTNGNIYIGQNGGMSLQIGNINTMGSNAIKAGGSVTLLAGRSDGTDSALNVNDADLIFTKGAIAGGNFLAIANDDLTILSGVTIGSELSGTGRVTLVVGEQSPSVAAGGVFNNQGTVQAGGGSGSGKVRIFADDAANTTLGNIVATTGSINQPSEYRATGGAYLPAEQMPDWNMGSGGQPGQVHYKTTSAAFSASQSQSQSQSISQSQSQSNANAMSNSASFSASNSASVSMSSSANSASQSQSQSQSISQSQSQSNANAMSNSASFSASNSASVSMSSSANSVSQSQSQSQSISQSQSQSNANAMSNSASFSASNSASVSMSSSANSVSQSQSISNSNNGSNSFSFNVSSSLNSSSISYNASQSQSMSQSSFLQVLSSANASSIVYTTQYFNSVNSSSASYNKFSQSSSYSSSSSSSSSSFLSSSSSSTNFIQALIQSGGANVNIYVLEDEFKKREREARALRGTAAPNERDQFMINYANIIESVKQAQERDEKIMRHYKATGRLMGEVYSGQLYLNPDSTYSEIFKVRKERGLQNDVTPVSESVTLEELRIPSRTDTDPAARSGREGEIRRRRE